MFTQHGKIWHGLSFRELINHSANRRSCPLRAFCVWKVPLQSPIYFPALSQAQASWLTLCWQTSRKHGARGSGGYVHWLTRGKWYTRTALSLFAWEFISAPDSSLQRGSTWRPSCARGGWEQGDVWKQAYFSNIAFPLQNLVLLRSHYRRGNWNSQNLGHRYESSCRTQARWH